MKIFVISDIHGHYTVMKEALDTAGFDKNNENHLLICCGDYFDRGNENVEVLQFFERLERKVLLRGNHEDMLLKLLETGKVMEHHYINGTFQTLENFFGKYSIDPLTDTIDFSGKNRTVDRICDFIYETIDYYETDKYLFVHGWVPNGCTSAKEAKAAPSGVWIQARETRWTTKYEGENPLSDKTLVCGHMPTFYANHFDPARRLGSTEIFFGNGLIAIDGATYDTKKVNVLVLDEC